MTAPPPLYACLPERGADPEAILAGFLRYAADLGLSLYAHQEEALLALMQGHNVIVNTPTGSGKSLIAAAAHFKALAEGRRSFYTCPIKALVSEKFFALCREFGPDRVGMMTGDATVNRDAPIICCTAEVLANIALADGSEADVDSVVMDEFHYVSDKERGVAWQIPLLTLPQARFVLMSATLGDVSVFERTIEAHTGAPVTTIRTVERPVPLEFSYEEISVQEAVRDLFEKQRAPVYVVSFTQRSAAETAQDLLSVDYCTKAEKQLIANALVGESFRSPLGRELQRLIRHGVGIHHAGLLPRYRLLVEKLAQRGLLKIICGTDTLGVGVNVPIRTVLLTKLCRYDGEKTRILSARDFHQIAGRAGRKGFDERGYVVALAPEHMVENLRLEAKARSGTGNKKKFVKKKPPEWGYVHWDRAKFEELCRAEPEPLVPRFRVTSGMLLLVLGRPSGGCSALKSLVKDSLQSDAQKRRHKEHALVLLRSLWQAGVVDLRAASAGGGAHVSAELQEDFSLFHTLGLYLVDAVERLERESPTYALDVLTLVEAIVEDPDVILRAQMDKLKGEKVAELKAAGVEYDQRMLELEKVEHPKPNLPFLEQSFAAFAAEHPWVSREDLGPKSIAREMLEGFLTFSGYVKEYGLPRSEGLLLRYLTEVYKTLVQSVPETAKDESVEDVIEWLGTLVRGVDSSLLDEWMRLENPAFVPAEAEPEPERDYVQRNPRAFTALIRNLMFSFLRALDRRDYESALHLVDQAPPGMGPVELERALRPLFEGGESIQLDQAARSPTNTVIEHHEGFWSVTQSILVEDEVSEYFVKARVDLARSAAEHRVVIELEHVGV
jgi:superfamily II RNA helicase